MKTKVFRFLKWCFFGEVPKKIPCPQPKPVIITEPKEHWQFVKSESHESCMTWQSSDFVSKTRPSAPTVPVQTPNQKAPTLTEDDEQELLKRGLEVGKAITIKPYWFNEISRFNAATTINIKGFSESIVGKYYAAFNAVQDAQYIENQ
jgi:hypothetical protein